MPRILSHSCSCSPPSPPRPNAAVLSPPPKIAHSLLKGTHRSPLSSRLRRGRPQNHDGPLSTSRRQHPYDGLGSVIAQQVTPARASCSMPQDELGGRFAAFAPMVSSPCRCSAIGSAQLSDQRWSSSAPRAQSRRHPTFGTRTRSHRPQGQPQQRISTSTPVRRSAADVATLGIGPGDPSSPFGLRRSANIATSPSMGDSRRLRRQLEVARRRRKDSAPQPGLLPPPPFRKGSIEMRARKPRPVHQSRYRVSVWKLVSERVPGPAGSRPGSSRGGPGMMLYTSANSPTANSMAHGKRSRGSATHSASIRLRPVRR